MSTEAVATLATAAFAAVAAGASWASIWQARRERLAAATPDLRIEVTADPTTKQISIHLHNHGGPAMRVRFGVAVGSQVAFGHPGPTSTFQRGEGRIITTPIGTPGGVRAPGFIAGWNTAGTKFYVFTTDDPNQQTFNRRDLRELEEDGIGLMKRVLPDFDVRAVTLVRYETAERWF